MTTRPADPGAAMTGLAEAARQALRAPSLLNTQPWSWRVRADRLELVADRTRHLAVMDPTGRLLTLSCGAALHHARVALAADGWRTEVTRLPGFDGDALLASIRLIGRCSPPAHEVRLRDAIAHRRTDRRAFSDEPVPRTSVQRLRAAVLAQACGLHIVRPDQMPMLAVATAEAAAAERADPAYVEELTRWTNRPPESGDGVPTTTAVRQGPRRVPVRDYALGRPPGLEVGPGHDRGAVYAILFGSADRPADWLRAGEGLSALLLTAVVEGLSTAPLSDTIELDRPRQLIRGLLPDPGEPLLVVRVGVGQGPDSLPPTPRRDPLDVIDVSD